MSHMVTLTPLNGCSGYHGGSPGVGSTVKSLSFFLLFAGIIFISIGYLKNLNRTNPQRVEYRYIPRSFQEEQAEKIPLMSVMGKMFSQRDPLSRINGFVDTFPWQRYMINDRLATPHNNPSSGFGRAVGQRIIG